MIRGGAGARGCKAADYPCKVSTCEGSSALVAQSQVLKEMMEHKLKWWNASCPSYYALNCLIATYLHIVLM